MASFCEHTRLLGNGFTQLYQIFGHMHANGFVKTATGELKLLDVPKPGIDGSTLFFHFTLRLPKGGV